MSALRTGQRIRQRRPPVDDRVAASAPAPLPDALRIGAAGGSLDQPTADRIRGLLGTGDTLESAPRERMEQQLGHSFADVHVHADRESEALNHRLGASAFTLGSDIFLTPESQRRVHDERDPLLTHELTHVVQQRSDERRGPIDVAGVTDSRETHARQIGDAVTADRRGPALSVSPPAIDAAGSTRSTIHREPDDQPGGGASLIEGVGSALRTLTAVASDPVNAMTGYRGPVTVDAWHERYNVGPVRGDSIRLADTVYLGDTFVVAAKISGPAAAAISTLHTTHAITPAPDTPSSRFDVEVSIRDGDTVVWSFTPTTPGRQTITLRVGDALGMNGDDYSFNVDAVSDVAWFKGRLSTAESKLNTMYATGEAWFFECFQNYIAAYRSFEAALSRQDAADRLVGQLLLGALFAVAGGAAGGAVGSALTPLMSEVKVAGEVIRKGLGNVTRGTLTDMAKDLSKWIVRLPDGALRDRLLKKGGGTGPAATAQASTDAASAGVAMGEGAVAAIDPLQWFAMVQTTIKRERAEAGTILTDLHDALDRWGVVDPRQTWEWDPTQTVTDAATLDGRPLDQLGPVPQALAYERSMWEVWLTNYAWKVIDLPTQGAASWFAKRNVMAVNAVGGKLEDEIERVASKFGESAEQWITRYGAASKAATEAEIKRIRDSGETWGDYIRRQSS